MLVGHIKTQLASAIVSFVKVSGPEVRVLEIMHGGLMGHTSAALDKLLASELLKIVESGAVDSLCFQRLPLRSGLLREIRRLPGLRGKLRIPHRFSYSVLPLPGPNGKTEQLFPGKTRREFRRKARILERTFPGQVSLRTFSLPEELNDGLRDAMSVAVSTWQRYLDLGLSDTAQTREALRFFAGMGWLRIFILYIHGVPCAFLGGQLYNNTFYSQFAGYHLDYARFSVGSVLIGRVFREIAASGVRDVDLGEGGQEHNRRLGCPMLAEATVHVYAPTPRGKLLKLFFGSLHVVRRGGRRTQSSLRLDWLAKIWRQELLSRRLPPLSS
jgi:CelD/BcsL family acetyltransferase involved in cellulose biosynthesis